MSEQSEREWKSYLLSKGVFGNALRFAHLEKPEEADRTSMGAAGVVWWTMLNAGGWSEFASAIKKNHYRSIFLIIFITINEPIIISSRAVQHAVEHFIIRNWSLFEHRNFAHRYFINRHWSVFEHHNFSYHRYWLLLNIATTAIKIHWSLLNVMFSLMKVHWCARWMFLW